MLVIHRTPPPSPRLATLPPRRPPIALPPPLPFRILFTPPTSIFPTRNPRPILVAPHAPRNVALLARDRAHPRLQHDSTVLTRARRVPRQRQEGPQPVSLHGLLARLLQPDAEVAQELGVPLVRVRGEELVCLLEGEEVEDELSDARVLFDLVVEDPGVARGEDRVCLVGELGHCVDDQTESSG